MLNSLEVYRYAGTKAGRARNHNDEALARHLREWLGRALALETFEDRRAGQAAFNEAYKEARRGVMRTINTLM